MKNWKKVAVLVAFAIGSVGCTNHQPALEDGQVVKPPIGWADYCARNLEDPSC